MTTNQIYFDEYGELNTLGRMLYAEAILLKKIEELPTEVYNHVQESPWASAEIIELYQLIEDEEYNETTPHPFFDFGDKTIGGNPLDIDQILAQLKSEATINPIYEKAIADLVLRNTATASALKAIKPISEQLITEDYIDFEWETMSNKPLVFTFETSKKRLIKERLTVGTTRYRLNLQPNEKFPSGLYYWKLAVRGGNPFIGKLYIYREL